RHGEVLGEGAVSAEDPHHPALRAVPAEPAPAGGATAAGEVDLADDPLDGELGGAVDDLADELVDGNAGEALYPGQDMQVGGADARQPDPHDRLARAGARLGMGVGAAQRRAVEVERPHHAAR